MQTIELDLTRDERSLFGIQTDLCVCVYLFRRALSAIQWFECGRVCTINQRVAMLFARRSIRAELGARRVPLRVPLQCGAMQSA